MWFLFSALSAVFDAAKNVFVKETLNQDRIHPIVITWAWAAFALPVSLVLAMLNMPHGLDHTFWLFAISGASFDFVGMFLFVLALKYSDLSLSLPMLVMVPLILLLTGFVVGHELPTPLGIFGVVLVVVGAYFLNFKRHRSKPLDPFIAIFKNKGSVLMLGVAALWGISTPFQKVAILHSNPYFFSAFNGGVMLLGFTPLAFFLDRKNFMASLHPKKWIHIAPAGVTDGLAVLFQFMAQRIEFSVFVIAVKRTSILLSSVAGAVMFKEKIKDRIIPIGMMLVGVAAIALSKV